MGDTKDWTWVLERRCDECGFDAASVTRADVGPLLLRAASDLQATLVAPGATVRPAPEVWSALEYACHVRDVYRLYLERLELMLGTDDPTYPNWDQDQTAITARYGEQVPSEVSVELGHAAEALAARFAALSPPDWDRTGTRSDGARFTVTTFSQYLVHDPIHHVWDVTRTSQSKAQDLSHEWDDDPAQWVRSQRADPRRTG